MTVFLVESKPAIPETSRIRRMCLHSFPKATSCSQQLQSTLFPLTIVSYTLSLHSESTCHLCSLPSAGLNPLLATMRLTYSLNFLSFASMLPASGRPALGVIYIPFVFEARLPRGRSPCRPIARAVKTPGL